MTYLYTHINQYIDAPVHTVVIILLVTNAQPDSSQVLELFVSVVIRRGVKEETPASFSPSLYMPGSLNVLGR